MIDVGMGEIETIHKDTYSRKQHVTKGCEKGMEKGGESYRKNRQENRRRNRKQCERSE